MVPLHCLVGLILSGAGLLAQASPRQSESVIQPSQSRLQEAKKNTSHMPAHPYRSDQSMTGVNLPERYQLTADERARLREQLRQQFQWVRTGAP